MATGALGPAAVTRVGDTVTLRISQGSDGSWSYEARILWQRDGHVGLTPPSDTRWHPFLQPGTSLWLCVRYDGVAARIRLLTVGLTADLPPVLVVRQMASAVPSRADGSRAIGTARRSPDGGLQ
jgi:hypothetical protein